MILISVHHGGGVGMGYSLHAGMVVVADGTEDADSLDMETGIEVVEEGVLRVLLPGIGVGKHSFGTGFTYSLAEICQVDLLFISEVLWHVGGAGVTLIDRLIRRVKIK